VFFAGSQLLICADDVNLLEDNTNAIKKNTDALIDGSKEVCLHAGQNHNRKIASRSFESATEFEYLGTAVRNQNLIHEEIDSRLNSGNACYHSVGNLLSYRRLFKNVKIKPYKTTSLLVVLYGCETWSLTLREGHRLRMVENRVLRSIFGPKRAEMTEGWRKLRNYELYNLFSSPSIIRMFKSWRMRLAEHVAHGGEDGCI
jgi:hypothetical protein